MEVSFCLVEKGELSHADFRAMDNLKKIIQAHFGTENCIFWRVNPKTNNPGVVFIPRVYNPPGPAFILVVQEKDRHNLRYLIGFWPNERKIMVYSHLIGKIITEGEIREILGIKREV